MPIAIEPLTDLGLWARRSGLEIVIIVTGAVLLGRLVRWAGDRLEARIDAEAEESDELVRSEASKHRHALTQVISWVLVVLIYCVAVVLVVQRLGVPITGLVAPATIVGVALGFGAQRIVQDLLAGVFLVTERQYGFGDVVRLSVLGVTTPVTGTVEDVTLRVTQLRTLDGEVVTTPNGQIVQVTNLSRDWARVVLDVPLPPTVDLPRVTDTLQRVGAQAYDDEELRPLLLDAPSVMGLESLAVDELKIRMVARTLPGKQFELSRELRARVAVALHREGIVVSPSSIESTEAAGVSA